MVSLQFLLSALLLSLPLASAATASRSAVFSESVYHGGPTTVAITLGKVRQTVDLEATGTVKVISNTTSAMADAGDDKAGSLVLNNVTDSFSAIVPFLLAYVSFTRTPPVNWTGPRPLSTSGNTNSLPVVAPLSSPLSTSASLIEEIDEEKWIDLTAFPVPVRPRQAIRYYRRPSELPVRPLSYTMEDVEDLQMASSDLDHVIDLPFNPSSMHPSPRTSSSPLLPPSTSRGVASSSSGIHLPSTLIAAPLRLPPPRTASPTGPSSKPFNSSSRHLSSDQKPSSRPRAFTNAHINPNLPSPRRTASPHPEREHLTLSSSPRRLYRHFPGLVNKCP
ncbi:hypothetical protein JCM11641_002783 [Rhodosporidiobolus odoratus]